MRYTPTILLVILATLLGGLALVHTGSKYRSAIFGTTATERGELLFDVEELDKVRRITLTDSEGKEAVFRLAGNIWVSDSPWEDRADPLYIRSLFQFTAGLEVQEVIPRTGLELSEFGLREGHTRITMADSKGNLICDYRLGRLAAWNVPTEDGKATLPTTYIRMADKELKRNVYLCSIKTGAAIHSLFNQQFSRFRDHHPFHFSPAYLDKVSIQSAEGEVVLSRPNLRSGWSITKPLELRVDPAAISELFVNMARLTAIKVEDRSSVTLPTAGDTTNQAREISIHFAGAKDDIKLHVFPPATESQTTTLATISDRPDAVFHLPLTQAIPGATALSQLQAGVNDLRSKTMTHLNGPQLKTIIIRPTGRPDTLLTRTKKTTWRVFRRKGYESANQEAVIDLMTAVTRDKVQKFITDAATDLKPYGLDRPFLQIGFVSFNDEGMRIALGRGGANKENIYAHIVGRPNIWQISNETVGKIAINPWQWRTAHTWHIPKVDVTQIDIERKGKPPVTLNFDYFSGLWKAKVNGVDATGKLNPNRADNLLSNLEGLETTKWLGPVHLQANQAMQTPDTIIRVHVQRVADDGTTLPPVIKTLKIAHTPGNFIYFAKIDTVPYSLENEGEENYFLLNPETIKKLYVDLFE
ncbi:hypothetical protein NT6N_39690 [Oceaniferula spumae]|uniref:DUF4340 domain-containing protein n=1 Tax=Oceaniferula spumae TaxID=2979115 RepID=A0AAT9FSQ5_9BACT